MPVATRPSGRGPTTAGGRRRRATSTADHWESWWRHNGHPFVSLRVDRGTSSPRSGSLAFLTGMGKRGPEAGGRGPTASDLIEEIIPVLEDALRSDNAAVLPLTRIGIGRVRR